MVGGYASSAVAIALGTWLLAGCASEVRPTDRSLAERDAYLHCLFSVREAAKATGMSYSNELAFQSCTRFEARYAERIQQKADVGPAGKRQTADQVIADIKAAFAAHP